MERSLVRIGDCSEVSRCFITEICCALLIYIQGHGGMGRLGGEQLGRSSGNKVLKGLGREGPEMEQS